MLSKAGGKVRRRQATPAGSTLLWEVVGLLPKGECVAPYAAPAALLYHPVYTLYFPVFSCLSPPRRVLLASCLLPALHSQLTHTVASFSLRVKCHVC